MEVEIASKHGQGFKEGAALVGDVQHFAFAAAEEENFEVVETYHDERFVDVSAVFEHGGQGVLKPQAGQAGHMKVADDGHLDVAIDIHQISRVVG